MNVFHRDVIKTKENIKYNVQAWAVMNICNNIYNRYRYSMGIK